MGLGAGDMDSDVSCGTPVAGVMFVACEPDGTGNFNNVAGDELGSGDAEGAAATDDLGFVRGVLFQRLVSQGVSSAKPRPSISAWVHNWRSGQSTRVDIDPA